MIYEDTSAVVQYRTRNKQVPGSIIICSRCRQATLRKLLTYCVLRGQLGLLPSEERGISMTDSVGYWVKGH